MKKTKEKICLTCSKPFPPAHFQQKYCGIECYRAAVAATKTGKIVFPDIKLPLNNYDQIWAAAETFQANMRILSTHQDEATIVIDTKTPILLALMADLHIGAISGRLLELRERVDLISTIKNLYVVVAGDTVDNYLPTWHSSGQFEALIPPEIQKGMAEYILSKIKDKILALIQGCHDNASHDTDDFDWTKYLQRELGCVNLGFGGFLNLKVGEQTYRIHVRHKFRFNSYKNPTHTCKRLIEVFGDMDIGVVGHNHQAAIETMLEDKKRIFIRPGSFKGLDRYARQIGFADGGQQIPTVLLYPDRKEMVGFFDLGEAVKYAEK